MIRSLTARCFWVFFALDWVFSLILGLGYAPLLESDASHGKVIGLLVALTVLRQGTWGLTLWRLLAETRRWERLGMGARSDAALRRADAEVQFAPGRFATVYTAGWTLQYPIFTVVLLNLMPEWSAMRSEALPATLVMSAATVGGILSFSLPLMQLLVNGFAGDLYIQARARGIELERPPGSMQLRVALLAMCLALGPALWLSGVGYMQGARLNRTQATVRSELVAARLAHAVEALAGAPSRSVLEALVERESSPGEAAFIVDPDNSVLGKMAAPAFQRQPSLRTELALSAAARERASWLDPGESQSIAIQRAHGRYIAGAIVDHESFGAGLITTLVIIAFGIAIWAPLSASLLSRSVVAPVHRVTAASRKVVEEGKLDAVGVLPASQNDEVGALTEHFNDVIELMRSMSKAAMVIAKGDLTVAIPGHGDLPEAFRAMLENLRSIVQELRGTSMDLASAASEIFAASQEQEAAATMQSSAMLEISRTMDNLAESAANVVEAVSGVLGNAEKTLENTDDMVKRIAQLGAHANRIGEILDVIRDIADRSDLLALNGSLEASRAGESGKGFALVAAEMRRLAERVTASVQDVKALVSDIRDSGSSTVMATEASKKLAQGTTEAARQITFAAQQQQTGTDQVSQGMRDIANVVAQAVAATTQTRTSAEGLKRRADTLSHLVQRFEVDGQARG